MKWNESDLIEFEARQLDRAQIDAQLTLFTDGVEPTQIHAPCTLGKGVRRFSTDELATYAQTYDRQAPRLSITKFVPASGAATRMFAHLHAADDADERYSEFMKHLPRFAFYQLLEGHFRAQGISLEALRSSGNYGPITAGLLGASGLNYDEIPKGSVPFHKYPNAVRTPFMEHLHEAAMYAVGKGGLAQVHFTVSPNFKSSDRQALLKYAEDLGLTAGCAIEVTFSEQHPSTDTLAVDENNAPFRGVDGRLLFRPGGHGALLRNLDALHADVIFIKNIDNVVPDAKKTDTVASKRALGGLLLDLVARRNAVLHHLDDGVSGAENDAKRLLRNWFVHEDETVLPDDSAALNKLLNRPIRVCGMVRNAGEPGGGPFWMRTSGGHCTAQIVEAAQIDLSNEDQREQFEASTHFNPVDLVCHTRDHQGEAYNLVEFSNPRRAFIAMKSVGSRRLKALERPGLWNGAMEHWLTVFVEVPATTFAPVKTVNDLLRPEHRA